VIFDHVVDGRVTELPERLPELWYFTLVPFSSDVAVTPARSRGSGA
jgi:hypothetical protein